MLRRSFWRLFVSFSVVVACGQQAALAGSGVRHSVHDFTEKTGWVEDGEINPIGWGGGRKELCRTCHVPHGQADVPYGNKGLLWNNKLTTKTNWGMYGTDLNTISFIDSPVETTPYGTSKMCLGCHDGSSAPNQYANRSTQDSLYGDWNAAKREDYGIIPARGKVSWNPSSNHPISMAYNQVADPGLNDPTVLSFATGETVESVLVNGRVECSTCHDVHDKESVGTRLLRDWQRGVEVTGSGSSALCFVCHNK